MRSIPALTQHAKIVELRAHGFDTEVIVKRYLCKKMDAELFREQLLIELMSGSGSAGELYVRLEERLGQVLVFDGSMHHLLEALSCEGLIFGIQRPEQHLSWGLQPLGIKRAEEIRAELVLECQFMNRGHPDIADWCWRRQLVRKQP